MSDLTWIDAHAHLHDSSFDVDRPAVLQRAADAGVVAVFCNGAEPGDWLAVAEIAGRGGCVADFGLHPWFVSDAPSDWPERLERFLDATPSAIGEIGLDRWVEPRDEALQEDCFRRQLEIAHRRRLPASIHCLQAWGWLLDILRDAGPPPAGMLIHAFGGSTEVMGELAEMGGYFSFAGDTLLPRKKTKQAAFRACPADRLLVETDCPDLPPPDEMISDYAPEHRGRRRTEPAFLARTGPALAALRGCTPVDLSEQTTSNARRLFGSLLEDRP